VVHKGDIIDELTRLIVFFQMVSTFHMDYRTEDFCLFTASGGWHHMKKLRHSILFTLLALLSILLTACGGMMDQGGQTGATNQNNSANQKTNQNMGNGTPATNGTNNNGNMDNGNMQAITVTPDTTGNTTAFIRTGKATIDGKEMSVLLTSKGFPIYYYKPDTALKSTCTGDCAKDWPPVLMTQGMMVSSSVMLPKELSIHKTTNGMQVFYDGHALYTYASDKQAGQATGHGDDMQWFLVDSMMNAMATTKNGDMMNGGTPTTTTGNMNNGNMNNGGMNNGDMNNGGMAPVISIVPNMMGNMNAFIHMGRATINGNKVDVLMTNKNFALYYYRSDTMFTSTCTGDCAKDWPPVMAPQGMMTISSSTTLPKKLSIHQTANGMQVFYDGHALYTYAEDKDAGKATGRGEDKLWYLVGTLL
jgi:predicted lipoprotein with Yx(FWY)xxD motif